VWIRAGLASAAFLASLGLVLAIAATWVSVRLPPLARGRPNVELQDFVRDASLGWRPPERFRWLVRTSPESAPSVFFSTNRLGFRADEPDWPARGAAMVLGDSFVQGYFLSQSETVTAALSRRLGGYVYNLGVGGYSTDQEYTLLTRVLEQAAAPWVVVMFCINDLPYLDRDSAWDVAKPVYAVRDGSVDFEALVPVPSARLTEPMLPEATRVAPGATIDDCCLRDERQDGLSRRAIARTLSYAALLPRPTTLLGTLQEDIRATKRRHFSPQLPDASYRSPAALDDRWRLAFQFFLRIQELSRRHGARTLVFFIPEVAQVANAEAGPFHPQQRFLELCRESDLQCVEPSSEFLAAQRTRWLYFADDGHLSPDGAELAARLLAEEMSR
jgi:hypothetical protein